jgi:hypothetical protein
VDAHEIKRVPCPLCILNKDAHEIPVSPNTHVFDRHSVMASGATWRKRPLYLRCPLCAGKGVITRELAAAWVLIDTQEYALPTYNETLRVRRAVSPRSVTTRSVHRKGR